MDYEGVIESDTDRGKVTIEMWFGAGGHPTMQITCSDSSDTPCSVYIEIAQARELAAMLLQAANVADGLPARPTAIEDVPLQYEHRADNDKSTPFRPLPSEMRLEDNGAYPVIRLADDSAQEGD